MSISLHFYCIYGLIEVKNRTHNIGTYFCKWRVYIIYFLWLKRSVLDVVSLLLADFRNESTPTLCILLQNLVWNYLSAAGQIFSFILFFCRFFRYVMPDTARCRMTFRNFKFPIRTALSGGYLERASRIMAEGAWNICKSSSSFFSHTRKKGYYDGV